MPKQVTRFLRWLWQVGEWSHRLTVMMLQGFALSFVTFILLVILLGKLPLILETMSTPEGHWRWTAAFLVLAVLAYLIKLHRRILYGFIELAVGAVAVWQGMDKFHAQFGPGLLALLTGLFIFGRAIENIHVGIKANIHAAKKQRETVNIAPAATSATGTCVTG